MNAFLRDKNKNNSSCISKTAIIDAIFYLKKLENFTYFHE